MASSDSQKAKKFDLNFVYTQLSACYEKSDKLDVDSYILAYHEFNKFFGLMGTVFGFVASDVQSKLDILEDFRKGDHKDEFETVERMILYEKKENLLENVKYISGSRTLLRLHRALIFIALFLEEVHGIAMDQKLSSICQKSYSATLGKFHPWLIQKAALMAMYTLPTKEGLLNRIKSPDESADFYNDLLPKAVGAMKEVYNRMQKFYQEHDILDLP